MPRLTKIYTRSGDDGSTMLGSGARVSKDSARIAAYGTVDELNSAIGVAMAQDLEPSLVEILKPVQNDLFHLGSDLCFPEEAKAEVKIPQIEQRHVDALEAHLDRLSSELTPLENFILPGGTKAAAQLHLARCVCRRAERCVVSVRSHEPVGEHTLPFLNRLSDLLFVMSRYENMKKGGQDVCWDSRA